MVQVSREDLDYMANFTCEHPRFCTGPSAEPCNSSKGVVCNSCWTANWAKSMISKYNEQKHAERMGMTKEALQ